MINYIFKFIVLEEVLIIEYMIEYFSEIVNYFSVLVNILLFIMIIYHHSNLTDQFELLNRPWLVFEGERGNSEIHFSHYYLTNIGKIPATNVQIHVEGTVNPIISNKTSNERKASSSAGGIALPRQKQEILIHCLDYHNIELNNSYSFEITINYKYGKQNKKCIFQLSKSIGLLNTGNLLAHPMINCIESN